MEVTTISISKKVKEELEKLKGSKSWDGFLLSLANTVNTQDVIILPEPEKKEVKPPENLHDLIIEAIEEVKPPSKWRDIFMFLLMGALGGAGLGIILPW